jgi:large subunit ribosomal protein L28
LKYFHPIHEITSQKDLYGKDSKDLPPMPPYPYGPNRYFPAADTGLYGGAKVQSGNKISKGRNKGKTLRRWYPNVRLEKVRSEALGQDFTIKITAACMRTINKCGGLDQYLLGNSPARIKELGLIGWRLRWRVMMSPKIREKFQKQRLALGLPEADPAVETFQQAYARSEVRQEIQRLQTDAWNELKEKNKRFEEHIKSRLTEKEKEKFHLKPMTVLMNQSPSTIP